MHRILGCLLFFVFASADAALISRLSGQAYYDDVLDITWAADANISGLEDWSDQVAWAASLNIVGVTGWRLASVDVNGDETVVACSGATELACRDNELGYMFYQNGVSTGSPSPFTDLQSNFYWSGTEHATLAGFAWGFGFPTGFQSAIAKGGLGYAWAVHSGDVAAIPVPEPVGLQVRCMHEPIYPQAGEEVTITAQGIDDDGDLAPSNEIEIYVNNMAMPFKRVGGFGVGTLSATYTPAGGDFSYGCRAVKATETAQSWRLGNAQLRSVDVGGANNPDWEAQPVFYNGPIKNKIDIVFFHDDTEYTSYVQPAFLTAVHDLINDGLWSIPWFVEHQWAFNFWIARADGADASPEPGPPPAGQNTPNCNRENTEEIKNIFNKKYKFRDAGAIVHSSNCRDNANVPRTFTIQANSPLVLPHEMGHRPFGMADEYCKLVLGASFCDGGHHQTNPFSNIYRTENGCRNSAVDRPYDANDCRLLIDANNNNTWWLGEPPYQNLLPSNQTRDLMQQTGAREIPPGSGIFFTAYAVGLTEITRMNWYVQQCIDGEC